MAGPSVQQLILKLKAVVRLEESAILAEIERTIAGASAARRLSNEPMENTPISCGDRMHIKNKVKKPADHDNHSLVYRDDKDLEHHMMETDYLAFYTTNA
jgi:hypothetical protein